MKDCDRDKTADHAELAMDQADAMVRVQQLIYRECYIADARATTSNCSEVYQNGL